MKEKFFKMRSTKNKIEMIMKFYDSVKEKIDINLQFHYFDIQTSKNTYLDTSKNNINIQNFLQYYRSASKYLGTAKNFYFLNSLIIHLPSHKTDIKNLFGYIFIKLI